MGNNGYVGSSDLQTSTANMEVVPNAPVGWTIGYNLTNFSFYNDQACHVKINGGNQIYLRAGQGLDTSDANKPITSFVIVESGITFNYFAAY
jgi:hypothetical protein